MEAGAYASADLVAAYFARADAVDGELHAYLARNPRALADAATIDRAHGGALHGAAVIVKDNLDTAGLATTAGSLALAHNVPANDATVVAKLRTANAVIVGKSNLSEWANFRGFTSTSGWSAVGGQTRHPLDHSRTPCGSSAGSAVAVASGTASAAIGTETNGSIICPASINGVVGFKPTVGLVSRAGIVPISSTQDTAGPITRTVGDAARILSVIAGRDSADPATAAIPTKLSLDFEAPLASATLAGKRLGVVRAGEFDAGTTAVFAAQLQRLRDAGAILVDVELPVPDGNDELLLLETEFKAELARYLAAHPVAGQPTTLAEVIAFDTAHADAELKLFGQELLVASEATAVNQAYLDAKQRLRATALDHGIASVMATNHLAALISPSFGPAWPINYADGDTPTGAAPGFAAVAGCPILTVPMGKVENLPVGISFFSTPFDDANVLALGYAYERLGAAQGR